MSESTAAANVLCWGLVCFSPILVAAGLILFAGLVFKPEKAKYMLIAVLVLGLAVGATCLGLMLLGALANAAK